MRITAVFLTLFMFTSQTRAFEVEAFAGFTSTSYDATSEANTYGISVRTKLNFYGERNHGFFELINARGESLLAADTLTGYAFRSSSDWFVEGGLGLSYSSIYGPGLGLLVGTGYRFTSNLFINFPLTYGTTGIFWSPYVGYKF